MTPDLGILVVRVMSKCSWRVWLMSLWRSGVLLFGGGEEGGWIVGEWRPYLYSIRLLLDC